MHSDEWKTETVLNSDRIPIIIGLGRTFNKIESDRKTYINFNKPDWEHNIHRIVNVTDPSAARGTRWRSFSARNYSWGALHSQSQTELPNLPTVILCDERKCKTDYESCWSKNSRNEQAHPVAGQRTLKKQMARTNLWYKLHGRNKETGRFPQNLSTKVTKIKTTFSASTESAIICRSFQQNVSA